MDSLPALINYIAGAATGLVIALVLAWVDRRWRRQDVRAAEKRARLDERFQPVRNYTAAICEFLWDAAACMSVWNDNRSSQTAEGYADVIREQIQNKAQKLEHLEPALGQRFQLRGAEAWTRAIQLRTLATASRKSCLHNLDTLQAPDLQEFSDRAAKADEHMTYILNHMTQMLDAVE